MKNLKTIQKTFEVFGRLSMIAMIISFCAMGAALLGLLCTIEWQTEGTIGFGRNVMAYIGTTSLKPAICELLSDAIFALTDGLLFLSAWCYFKAEQEDGTPFTHSGADRIKNLGIKTIVMPIVAVIISAVIYQCFDIEPAMEWGNAVSVVLGIILILAAQVFHYGAELESK